MSSDRPAVRARSAKDFLAYLDHFRPGTTATLRARIPPASLELIDHTLPNAWIPMEHDRHIVENTVDILGAEQAQEAWTSFLVRHLDAPMYRSIIKASVRLFGLSPGTFAWAYPRGWKLAYQNCCALYLQERGDAHAVLLLEDIHPELFRRPAYFVCYRGIFDAPFRLAMTSGQLDFELDENNRCARAELRWSEDNRKTG